MNRRQALRSVAAVACLPVAGCSSFGQPSGVYLGDVRVVNMSLVQQRIRVVVKRDGAELVRRTFALGPPPGETDQGAPVVDHTRIEPTWERQRAAYTIEASHVGENGSAAESAEYEHTYTSVELDRYDEPQECLVARLDVGRLERRSDPRVRFSSERVDRSSECHPTSATPVE